MSFNKARALQEAEKSVAQGKLSQAIQQYLVIIENEPGDLALLNTVGDLCIHDRNIAEALRLFRRLADAYAREGFTLKAIAIYRKITKLDPNDDEPLLRLAELYTAQGLGREGLKLYAEALESAERRNQNDRALDIMRRVVAADPENEGHRLRLAEGCEAMGRSAEAARVYLDAAEAAWERGDRDSASELLAKAADLEPAQPGAESLRARLAPVQAPESPLSHAPEPTPAPELGLALPPAEEGPGPVETLGTESPVATFPAFPLPLPDDVLEEQLPLDTASRLSDEALAASPGAPVAAPMPAAREFDLSSEWEAITASSATAAATVESPALIPSFNEEETRAEVQFYLDTGLAEEARRAVQALDEKFPGHPQVAELRRRVEEQAQRPAPAEPALPNMTPQLHPSAEPSFPAAPPRPVAAGSDLLQSLASDLESSWSGLDQPTPPPPPPAPKPRAPNAAKDFGAALGALLDELGEEVKQAVPEDPETHYSLGIAFREMGLLEEAIGEFQKVAKVVRSGAAASQFLQACTLLGVCFMDKQMPALAAKWYRRALESSGLAEDTRLALEYDLGMAYEQAGNSTAALERFLEVYSQNIDYRDVAEKIRLLQPRPS